MKITPTAMTASAILNPFMTPMERVATLAAACAYSEEGVCINTPCLILACGMYTLDGFLSVRKHSFKATMKRRVKAELVSMAIQLVANKLSKKKPNPHVFSLMKGDVITMKDDSVHIVVLAEAIVADIDTDAPLAVRVTTAHWTRIFNLDGSCALPEYPSITKVTK